MRKNVVVLVTLGVVCIFSLVALGSSTNVLKETFNSIRQSSLSKAFFSSEGKKDSQSTSKPENKSQNIASPRMQDEQNRAVPDKIVYFILFNHLVGLKQQAEKAQANGGVPLNYFELYKRQANLDDSQSQFLFQNAQDCLNAIKPIDEEAKAIIDKARANFPNGEVKSPEDLPQPPEELKELQQRKDEVILHHRDSLKNFLGEEKFAEFNSFARQKIVPQVDTNILPTRNQEAQVEEVGGYGYSYIENNQTTQTIYAETGTVLYYSFSYYYDPGIQGFLYKGSVLIAQSDRIIAQGYSSISVWTQTNAEAYKTYTLHGDHYVGAHFYYIIGGQTYYDDYYGLAYYAGVYSPPYSFLQGPRYYYTYRIYRAASTTVSITARPPLQLSSIDTSSSTPGVQFVTSLRGTGLFGNGQNVQVSGSGVTASVRPNQVPNNIEILDIEITIAENAERGDHQITLTVDGQTSNALTFRVGDRTPQITSMSPPQAETGENVEVTITGTGFGLNPQVQIDGLGVSQTTHTVSDTQIIATFSVADTTYTGDRNVTVKSRGLLGTGFISISGNSDTSNAIPFNISESAWYVEITNPYVTGNLRNTTKKAFPGAKFPLTARSVGARSGGTYEWKINGQVKGNSSTLEEAITTLGQHTVSVSYKVRSTTRTSLFTVNVVIPEIDRSFNGELGFFATEYSTSIDRGHPCVREFDTNFYMFPGCTENGIPGIEFIGSMDQSNAIRAQVISNPSESKVKLVQIVSPYITRTNVSNNQCEVLTRRPSIGNTSTGWFLDASDPYGAADTPPAPAVSTIFTTSSEPNIQTNDNPLEPLTNGYNWLVDHKFEMYLVYFTGENSQPQNEKAIAVIEWTYGGQTTYNQANRRNPHQAVAGTLFPEDQVTIRGRLLSITSGTIRQYDRTTVQSFLSNPANWRSCQ
jgi:hypothetical protein